MLLLNNNVKNHNSEKSIELCSIIANYIASQLLQNIISNKIKIFDTKEYFSLSKEEIIEVCKEEHFTDCTEEDFANIM